MLVCTHASSGVANVAVMYLFIGLIAFGYTTNHAYSTYTTWDTAVNCCATAQDSGLPMIQTKASFIQLIHEIELFNYTSVWLGITRQKLHKWEWLDTSRDLQLANEKGSCGVFNRSFGKSLPNHCSSLEHGYICEIQDCRSCATFGVYIKVCQKILGKCFLSFCEKKCWYDARSECKKYNGDLTVLKERSQIKEITKTASKCHSFWIGLRREKWGFKGTDVITVGMWGFMQPSDKGDCAVLNRKDDEYEIKVVSCFEEHAFTCTRGEEASTLDYFIGSSHGRVTGRFTSSTRDIDYGTEMVPKTYRIIGISVGITAAVIATLAVIFACVMMWRQKRRRPCRKTDQQREGPVESDSSTITALQEANREDDPTFETIPLIQFGMEDPETLSRLKRLIASKIKNIYGEVEMWSWSDETLRVPLDEVYIELSTYKVASHVRGPEESRLNSYHEILVKDYTEDFQPLRVILIGDAGTGKTTLCKKILFDWATSVLDESEQDVRKFTFILPIMLRHVSEGEKLEAAVQSQLQLEDEDALILGKLIEEHSDCVLYILDGYDEYDEKTSHDITNIAKGNNVRANVFITARAVTFGYVLEKTSVKYTKFVLKGFSERGVENYIDNFYEDQKELNLNLKEKINSSDDLLRLSKYPAILLLMVVLWKDTNHLSDTVTGFYKDFVDCLLMRNERKNSGRKSVDKESLVDMYFKDLMKIGKIAVDGLLGTRIQLVFLYDEVIVQVGESAWKLGIFCRDNVLKGQTYVSFYHKTVQEYFASYFIVNATVSERKKLLNGFYAEPGPLKDTTMMGRFISGLGGSGMLDQISEIIEGSSESTAELATRFQLEYLMENPSCKLKLPPTVYLNRHFNQTYDSLTSYLAMDTSSLSELTFELCQAQEIGILYHISSRNLKKLRLFYVPEGNILTTSNTRESRYNIVLNKFPLQTLKINYFRDSIASSIPDLCKYLDKISTLSTLDFSSSELTNALLKWLSGVIPSLSNLTCLCLAHTGGSNKAGLEIDPLINALTQIANLKVFDISGRFVLPLTNPEVHELFPRLNELRLGNYIADHTGAGCFFVNQLKSLPELEVFQAGENSFGNKGIQMVSTFIPFVKKMTYMDLTSCGCQEENEWLNMFSQLGHMTKLETLILARNSIGKKSVVELCRVIMKMQCMHHLDMTRCGISGQDSARPILQIIQSHLSILSIVLSGNDISSVSTGLIDAVINRKSLIKLDVLDSNLDPDTILLIDNYMRM